MSKMGEIYAEIEEFLDYNWFMIKAEKYEWLNVSMLSEVKR
jgi:hypothetical protein